MKKKIGLWLVFLLPLAAAVAYLAALNRFDVRLRLRLESWEQSLRARGFFIAYRESMPWLGGLKTSLQWEKIEVFAPEAYGGWRLTAPRVSGYPSLFYSGTLGLPEGASISFPDGDVRTVSPFKVSASVRAAPFGLSALKLDSLSVTAKTPSDNFAVEGLNVSLQPQEEETTPFMAKARKVSFPAFHAAGKAIDLPALWHLQMKGTWEGSVEMLPYEVALAGWRNDGGLIDITALSFALPPLRVESASGSLALDAENRWIAAFSGKVVGFEKTLDVLAERKLIDRSAAVLAKLAVNALVPKDRDGDISLPLSISLQNDTVYLGPLALYRLEKKKPN